MAQLQENGFDKLHDNLREMFSVEEERYYLLKQIVLRVDYHRAMVSRLPDQTGYVYFEDVVSYTNKYTGESYIIRGLTSRNTLLIHGVDSTPAKDLFTIADLDNESLRNFCIEFNKALNLTGHSEYIF